MRYVFVSYVYVPDFKQPQAWLKRINAYAGVHEALAKTNEVISIEQIDFEGQLTHNGVDYHFKRFGAASLKYFPLALNRYIKTLKPDVVILHGLHFPLQLIQLRLLLGSKVKIMVQNHAEKPFVNPIKKQLMLLADRCANAYLFASQAMGLEWITAGNLASPGKIHEVMEVSSVFHPIDRQEAIQHTGVTGNPMFLWVGRLNQNKDPLNVVSTFLKFADTAPQAMLYMIYHTDELLAELSELLNHHPQKKAVVFVGKVPHHELLYWFNSADFIISGSYYEGSGAAICEAMSCGCIPLVTDILSFRMITDNGNCGMLYPPGNRQALLNILEQTKQMDIPAKRALCLTYFSKNLSFEAIAMRIQTIAELSNA